MFIHMQRRDVCDNTYENFYVMIHLFIIEEIVVIYVALNLELLH
jgi:hypothetical protein